MRIDGALGSAISESGGVPLPRNGGGMADAIPRISLQNIRKNFGSLPDEA